MRANHCICRFCGAKFWGFKLADHEGAPRDEDGLVVTLCLECSRRSLKAHVTKLKNRGIRQITTEMRAMKDAMGGAP